MATLKELNQMLIQKFPENTINNRFRYLERGATLPEGWLLQTPDIWGIARHDLPLESDQASIPVQDGVLRPDFDLPACAGNSIAGSNCICTEIKATVSRPGMKPRKLCVGHSTRFVDEFYSMMIEAEQYILISNLGNPFAHSQGPDRHFLAALRNAITYLGHTKKKISIRVLIGNMYWLPLAPPQCAKEIMDQLTCDLKKISGARVSLVVLVSGSPSVWNHAKMLVVDAKKVIAGGHNLYSTKYLQKEPVFDLSMKLGGAIAVNAHNYFISNWKISASLPNRGEQTYGFENVSGKNNASGIPLIPELPEPEKKVHPAKNSAELVVPVMSIGRFGSTFDNEPSDEAILYMLENAEESIKLSQASLQLILNIWSPKFMSALAKFIHFRRKHVFIVLSSSYATDHYECAGNFSDVYKQILWEMGNIPGAPSESERRQLLNTYLHVEHIAFSPDHEWGPGSGIANHAKMVLVDDRMFYIGSHNMYPGSPGGLAEYGFIIDSRGAARQLLDQYWTKLWKYSESRVEVRTVKQEYAPGETVHVHVNVDGEMRDDAIVFVNESGRQEWETLTGNIRSGKVPGQYVVTDQFGSRGQTIRVDYITSSRGIRQVRKSTTFRIKGTSVVNGVELKTGKAAYAQNEYIDVHVKVGGAIKDDSIRFINESGREEWWTWTDNIREGMIKNSYKVPDTFLRTGQRIKIEYLYDGHHSRQVRQTTYCTLKPMKVTLKTDKPVYKVGEKVWVNVQVENATPYNDSLTFHRPGGKEDGWMWTGNVVNGYVQQNWGVPAHLKGQTVTIRYLYDGAGKKWLIAQTTFRVE